MYDAKNRLDPPSRSRCLTLMDECEMLSNIKAHSIKVCEVSLLIAKALQNAGIELDIELIEAGALLHDIAKTQTLGTKQDHAALGKAILEERGYPKTARVVFEHIIPDNRGDELTPCEIVSYADRRVLHDKLVEPDERFRYLAKTYGNSPRAMAYYDTMRSTMEHFERLVEQTTGRNIDDLIM